MKSDSPCILKSTLWDLGLTDELDVEDDGKKGTQTFGLSNQVVVEEDLGIWENPIKREKLIQESKGGDSRNEVLDKTSCGQIETRAQVLVNIPLPVKELPVQMVKRRDNSHLLQSNFSIKSMGKLSAESMEYIKIKGEILGEKGMK